MTYLQALLYGLISGFSEFIPVSSKTHQNLILYLMGLEKTSPLVELFIQIGMLIALLFSSRLLLSRIQRDKSILERSRRRRTVSTIPSGIFDLRLVRTACFPMLLLLLISFFFSSGSGTLSVITLLTASGILLLVTDYIPLGNKDARSFCMLDALLLGFFSGLSSISGLSRIGIVLCYSIFRGADRQKSFQWALLISIPALIVMGGENLVISFLSGGSIHSQLLVGFLAMCTAFCGSYLSISLMKYLLVKTGVADFSYYSWGLALFIFLINLFT